MIGEHGTSGVFLWSSARIGGMRVKDLIAWRGLAFDEVRQAVEHDVRYANTSIIEGIGASQYGIGMVTARIAAAIGSASSHPVSRAAAAGWPRDSRPTVQDAREIGGFGLTGLVDGEPAAFGRPDLFTRLGIATPPPPAHDGPIAGVSQNVNQQLATPAGLTSLTTIAPMATAMPTLM